MYLPGIFLQFQSHITCTLGNPFTHLGKNITPTCLYTREKKSFWLIYSIFMHWRAFPVGSIHISVRLYDRETTRCASDGFWRANWHEFFLLEQLLTPDFTHAYPVETGAVVIKNLVPVCMLIQNIRGTPRAFTNIESNRNMSISDWKCSSVLTYRLNQSKWTFVFSYPKVG